VVRTRGTSWSTHTAGRCRVCNKVGLGEASNEPQQVTGTSTSDVGCTQARGAGRAVLSTASGSWHHGIMASWTVRLSGCFGRHGCVLFRALWAASRCKKAQGIRQRVAFFRCLASDQSTATPISSPSSPRVLHLFASSCPGSVLRASSATLLEYRDRPAPAINTACRIPHPTCEQHSRTVSNIALRPMKTPVASHGGRLDISPVTQPHGKDARTSPVNICSFLFEGAFCLSARASTRRYSFQPANRRYHAHININAWPCTTARGD
jgi:hypothetical protein